MKCHTTYYLCTDAESVDLLVKSGHSEGAKGKLVMKEIKQIITKVREMYRFDTTIKDIIASPANIRVEEINGELKIAGIIFNYSNNDNVTVLPDAIKHYKRKENRWETLIKYRDFHELLNL